MKTAQWTSTQRMRTKDFRRPKWLSAVVDFPNAFGLNDSETSHFSGIVRLKKMYPLIYRRVLHNVSLREKVFLGL